MILSNKNSKDKNTKTTEKIPLHGFDVIENKKDASVNAEDYLVKASDWDTFNKK